MNRFIIVRHGETKGTEKDKYYGITDTPLSTKGKKQALELKKKIKKYDINYIYTSPLKRCIQTADLLLGDKNIPMEISHNIKEINFGSWEGLTLTEMQKQNPKKFREWILNFKNASFPEGERINDMVKRVEKFWKYILNRHNDKTILVVTHGGPAKVIIMDALGIPKNNFWNLHIDTCSISMIESYEKGFQVKAVNNR